MSDQAARKKILVTGLLALALAVAFTTCAPAEAGEAAEPPSSSSASSPPTEPAAAERPVLKIPDGARATSDFDVDRATEAWLDSIPPAARGRSDAYFEGGYWIQLVDWLWTLGVAVLLLAGGRARRAHDAIRNRVRSRFFADALTAAGFILVTSLLSLPLTIWVGYVREHAYGLSNQTLGAFLGDWGKGLGVSLLLAGPAIAAIYAVVRRAPRTWWLWGTGVTVVFMMFVMAIGPVWIAPLFNRYQKLEPSPLRGQILSLARSYEIPATDVYWFDASRQTKRVSANVSGFMGTTRISLNDNLLKRSPRETILAVLGHEMGHYVLNHVEKGIVEFALVIAAGFAFLFWSFNGVTRRLGAGWKLAGTSDPAGLPLAMALLATFFLIATPVTNTIVRTEEAEADAFGLAAARQPDGFAYAAVQLAEYRKMRPGPLEEFIFFDHPSGYHRIHRAMEWKQENLAECAARERGAEDRVTEPAP